MEKVITMTEDQSTERTEQKEGISINVDGIMEYAIYKIIEGTEMTIYIPEEVARKIAAAVLEEKVTVKSVPMVNDTGEELCQAEIEIIYDD